MELELTEFVRLPYRVHAVLITEENIEEVAKSVGTLDRDDDGPFIRVNRKRVPNVYKVRPGYWMTKLDKKIRCFAPHIFEAQFRLITPEVEQCLRYLDGEDIEDVEIPVETSTAGNETFGVAEG